MEGAMSIHLPRRVPISGTQLVAALCAVVLATVVLPPAAAWSLNRARIAQTRDRVQAAADRMRVGNLEQLGGPGTSCGPGRLPDLEPTTAVARAASTALPSHPGWLLGVQIAPDLFGPGMPTDAWGQCVLLSVPDAPDAPIWLLSAGPNGLIETGRTALMTEGDDIGARLR
jgi:hypothetical protein